MNNCLHDAELLDADQDIEAMPAWPPGPYCRTAGRLFEAAGLEVTFRSLFFGCATALYGRRPA